MARLHLGSSFQVIPEGTYIFKIDSVNYEEDFGKLEIGLITKDGKKHTERYRLLSNNGETNDKAVAAFSFFAKNVLNILDFEGDIDEQWLLGAHIKATVTHDLIPSKVDPNKIMTFARLKDLVPIAEPKASLPENYETFFDEIEMEQTVNAAAEIDLTDLF